VNPIPPLVNVWGSVTPPTLPRLVETLFPNPKPVVLRGDKDEAVVHDVKWLVIQTPESGAVLHTGLWLGPGYVSQTQALDYITGSVAIHVIRVPNITVDGTLVLGNYICRRDSGCFPASFECESFGSLEQCLRNDDSVMGAMSAATAGVTSVTAVTEVFGKQRILVVSVKKPASDELVIVTVVVKPWDSPHCKGARVAFQYSASHQDTSQLLWPSQDILDIIGRRDTSHPDDVLVLPHPPGTITLFPHHSSLGQHNNNGTRKEGHPSLCPSPTTCPYAFVTLTFTPSYIAGVVALASSLIASGSGNVPLVVIVPESDHDLARQVSTAVKQLANVVVLKRPHFPFSGSSYLPRFSQGTETIFLGLLVLLLVR
jgi:hypothetical protein